MENMSSVMSVAISLMDWRKCGNYRVRNLASKVRVSHQPPGVDHVRILHTVSLPPASFGPAWEADFGVCKIVIRFQCLQRGPAYFNNVYQSKVHLLCQDIAQTCLSLAVVGALERVGHATFGGPKQSGQRSELVVFCKTQI